MLVLPQRIPDTVPRLNLSAFERVSGINGLTDEAGYVRNGRDYSKPIVRQPTTTP